MAKLVRAAKSGSYWRKHDLLSYNIIIDNHSPCTFFRVGAPQLPTSMAEPCIDRKLFDEGTKSSTPGLSSSTYHFLRYLELAVGVFRHEEVAYDDMARSLLEAAHFERAGNISRTRQNLRLDICGQKKWARPNVTLVGPSDLILLLGENKTPFNTRQPEPQLIAEAIATYQYNNQVPQEQHLRKLHSMTFPAIVMHGTRPSFYRIPVTRDLNLAVRLGKYPKTTTHVARCDTTPGPTPGMKLATVRKQVFQQFVSFRIMSQVLWSALQG
jgi:hypothetical protein